MNLKNKDRRSANISIIIILIGMGLIIYPNIKNVDMMNWGFASAFVGGFIVIMGLLSFLIFNSRAKVMKKIIENEGILAKWTISKENTSKLDEEAYESAKLGKQASFVLGCIFTIIGLVMFFINTEENGIFLIIMFVVGLIIALVGRLSASVAIKKIKKNYSETTIILEGVYYRGDLYSWKGILNKLEYVMLDPKDNNSLLMIFKQLHGRYLLRHRCAIHIPIPQGSEEEAERIINLYGLNPNSGIMRFVNRMEHEE